MPRRRLQSTTRTSKRNRLNRQRKSSAHALGFFCTFFCRHCNITTGQFLISRFMVDVNRRQLIFGLHFGNLWKKQKKKRKKHLGTFYTGCKDFKMPRRRLQSTTRTSKSNRLNRQSKSSAHVSSFFCTFFCRHCNIKTEKLLFSRFMEDVISDS